jgi:hypothetical protein
LSRRKRRLLGPAERRFYAEVAGLDLSLYEDCRFVRDRPCQRVGAVSVSEAGELAVSMADADGKQRFKRAVASGKVAMRVGGMRDGALWDGVEYLDSGYAPNLLWWLCGWNDVGVFAVDTQRDLRRLFDKYGIALLRLENE